MASQRVDTLSGLARYFDELPDPARSSEAIDTLKTCILPELKAAITRALLDLTANRAFPGQIEGFMQRIQEAEGIISEVDKMTLSGILECSMICFCIARDFREKGASLDFDSFMGRAERCASFFSHMPVLGSEKGDCDRKKITKKESSLETLIREIFDQSDYGKGIIAKSIVEYLLNVKRKARGNRRIKVKLLIIEGLRPGLYKLELSQLSGGSGLFFPDPEFMVFTTFGKKDFILGALVPAWSGFSKKIPQDSDVEWRISRIHSRATSSRFEGTSAGAAFATALSHLIMRQPVDVFCAITGALFEEDPQKIAKVGFVSEKVKILLKSPEERGLTNTLVIPQENRSEAESLDFDTREFSIEYVSTLSQISHVLTRNKGLITRTFALGILLWLFLFSGSLCFFEPVIANSFINPLIFKRINEMTKELSERIVTCPVQIPYCSNKMAMKQLFLQKSAEILQKICDNPKKPRVIALDASFESEVPEMDKLAQVITRLCESNVTVITGLEAREKDNRNIVGDSDLLSDKLKLYCDPGKLGYHKHGLVNCGWFFSPFSLEAPKCAIILYLTVQRAGARENLYSLSFLSFLAMSSYSPLQINPAFSDEELYSREKDEMKMLWQVPSVGRNYMYLSYPIRSSLCKAIRFDSSTGDYTVSAVQFVSSKIEGSPGLIEERGKPDERDEALANADLEDKCIIMGREILAFPKENREDEMLDLHSTPMGRMPGFYLHAIALSQMLEGNFLRQITTFEFLLYTLFLFCLGILSSLGFGELEDHYLRPGDRRTRSIIFWSAPLLILALHSLLFFIAGIKFQLILMFSAGFFPAAGYIFGITKAKTAWKMHREGYF